MECTIGLAQTCHPRNGEVEALVKSYARRAREQGVDLLIFPEFLMSPYEIDKDQFIQEAEPLGGAFTRAIDKVAQDCGLWMVYTINEYNPWGNPYNTAVVVDDQGVQQGVYRKVHLFDTEAVHESDRLTAGDSLFEPIRTPFGVLGLAMCYDLRFPEVARAAAVAGCDVMIYPAAWVDGALKAEQWRTLLQARAIENAFFVAGVSRADKTYIGQSCLVDPQGVVLAAGGPDETLVVARIDVARNAHVRKRMPVLDHRRVDVYEKQVSHRGGTGVGL